MKFIVIEGLDGSGKSTQLELLQQYLRKKSIKFRFVHFPRPDAPIFGELISMFLRGEFGDVSEVNPYLVALLYAGDRKDAGKMIKTWLSEGYYVLMDRYVNSNIAFQCAKIDNPAEKEKLKNWIHELEFGYYAIPKPDKSLFLSVPFEFTRNKLSQQRKGDDRSYLKGQADIHEASLEFQQAVREEYLTMVREDSTIELIDCSDENNRIHSPEIVHREVVRVLELDK